MAAAAEARRRRARTRRLLLGAAAGLVVVVIAGLVVADRRAESRRIAQVEAGGCQYDTRSDRDAGRGNNHLADPVYSVDPPAGGDHLASPARPGKYLLTALPPDGELVHALEHGDVVIWHRPELERSVLDELDKLRERYPDDVLIVPRITLDGPVAATAWHRRLLCPTAELESLDRFVLAFKDRGPEKVPES